MPESEDYTAKAIEVAVGYVVAMSFSTSQLAGASVGLEVSEVIVQETLDGAIANEFSYPSVEAGLKALAELDLQDTSQLALAFAGPLGLITINLRRALDEVMLRDLESPGSGLDEEIFDWEYLTKKTRRVMIRRCLPLAAFARAKNKEQWQRYSRDHSGSSGHGWDWKVLLYDEQSDPIRAA